METKAWTYKDKSTWGDGPWQHEPDKVQFTDAATGLPCIIRRGGGGAWCGYVGVPEGHPWFGLDYDDDPVDADVHGGLTFAAPCAEGEDEHGICHIPEPGEPEHVHWFGFDCNHGGDIAPEWMQYRTAWLETGGVYRDEAYVRRQVASLAQQLAAVAP